ncbi:hypothetical protein, partial [Staphylococcus aureus]|uniref:hypothetical protein n=1 Tax=Staphylococcus aureus TaxID=1280 RepID=UPI0039BEB175
TLSAGGVPNKTTVAFTNNSCGPTCYSTLTITTNGTKKGSYTITVTGAPNGTGPRTTTFTLTVQ